MIEECEKVGLDYFDVAPYCYTATETIDATPQRIFDVLVDAVSWTKWVHVIKRVEWTSPFPLEVGSTRSVYMTGGLVGHEEFIAWDPPRRMAFRFNQADARGLRAFAEDYQVVPLESGASVLSWRMAMTPDPVPRLFQPLMRRASSAGLAYTLRRFKQYVESNPTLAPQPNG